MTSIQFTPQPISLGHLPGDPALTVPGGLRRAFMKRDVSADHVKIKATDVAHVCGFAPGTSNYNLTMGYADGLGYLTVADLIAAKWQDHYIKPIRALAQLVWADFRSREDAVTKRVELCTSEATTQVAQLEAGLGNAYQNDTVRLALQDAKAAAPKTLQALCNLAFTLELQKYPQQIVDGARAAFDSASERFATIEHTIAASFEHMQKGAEARKADFALTSDARDALTAKLAKATAAKWTFSLTKDLKEGVQADAVVDNIIRYGEVWVGKSATDPQLTPLRTRTELVSWVNTWIGS